MIDRREIELGDELRIEVGNWDGETEIPGYSSEIFDQNRQLAVLRKNPKSTALRVVSSVILGSVFLALTSFGSE
jgi:hypothetical protein